MAIKLPKWTTDGQQYCIVLLKDWKTCYGFEHGCSVQLTKVADIRDSIFFPKKG